MAAPCLTGTPRPPSAAGDVGRARLMKPCPPHPRPRPLHTPPGCVAEDTVFVNIANKQVTIDVEVTDPTPTTCGDAESVVVPVIVTVGGDGADGATVTETTGFCEEGSTAGTWNCEGLPAGEATSLTFKVNNTFGACAPACAPALRT